MKRKTVKLLSVVFSVMMLFSQTALAAKSVNDLRNELSEKKKETEKIKERIKEKQQDKNEATTKVRQIAIEISGVQDDIESVQELIDLKQREIDSANSKIEILNNDIAKTKKKLKARMKVMYEVGRTSYLEIIMESKGFSDLFTRIAAVQAIVRHDNKVMDDYANQIDELNSQKAVVESEQAEQIEAKGLLTEKKGELQSLKAQSDKLVKELSADIAKLEAEEKQKEKDAAALQSEINKALSKSKGTNVVYKGNGKFQWPSAASTKITSKFGYRIHPIFNTKKLHRGIDIGAPQGSNVLAAEAGVVLTAGYNGSYGNYVTINHGGGFVTLYAHNSKLTVKAGDKVSKGQVIAKCGSTGNSTGPHIHFEVQVNGSLVNPLNYL